MRDDGCRDGIEQLCARIVTEQQSGELVILYQRNRVAVLAILHRDADAVGEELSDFDRVGHHCTVVTRPSVASNAPVGSNCHAASRSPTTVSDVISSGVMPSRKLFSAGSSSARFAS